MDRKAESPPSEFQQGLTMNDQFGEEASRQEWRGAIVPACIVLLILVAITAAGLLSSGPWFDQSIQWDAGALGGGGEW